MLEAENKHPNRHDICEQGTQGAPFGEFLSGKRPTSLVPEPTPFGSSTTSSPFGGAAPTTSAFGQPSTLGQRPNPFGTPAFGQPAQPASTFGQPSQPAMPSASPLNQHHLLGSLHRQRLLLDSHHSQRNPLRPSGNPHSLRSRRQPLANPRPLDRVQIPLEPQPLVSRRSRTLKLVPLANLVSLARNRTHSRLLRLQTPTRVPLRRLEMQAQMLPPQIHLGRRYRAQQLVPSPRLLVLLGTRLARLVSRRKHLQAPLVNQRPPRPPQHPILLRQQLKHRH